MPKEKSLQKALVLTEKIKSLNKTIQEMANSQDHEKDMQEAGLLMNFAEISFETQSTKRNSREGISPPQKKDHKTENFILPIRNRFEGFQRMSEMTTKLPLPAAKETPEDEPPAP